MKKLGSTAGGSHERSASRRRRLATRARPLRCEHLEPRAMLAADAQWAPDTPQEVMSGDDHGEDDLALATLVGFTDSSRWNYTATAGFGMSQGEATVLTSSIASSGGAALSCGRAVESVTSTSVQSSPLCW